MTDHLAIMHQPWYNWVKEEKKPLESRCSMRKITPYRKVEIDDRIFFKETGNFPIYFYTKVLDAKYYIGFYDIQTKLHEYQQQICIDSTYIASKKDANYLSLIWLGKPQFLDIPIPFHQKGQMGWITPYIQKEWI